MDDMKKYTFFLFLFLLFLTPSFASQTYTRNKWYLSEKTGFDLLDMIDKDFTDLGMKKWQGKWYHVFRVDLEVRNTPQQVIFDNPDYANKTLKWKIKQCYKLNWADNCLEEMIDWYFPEPYSISELKEDLKDFFLGVKKLALTDKVTIKMINIDKQNLKISFYVGIRGGWVKNQKFKIGRKSETYTSGSVTIEYVENLNPPVINEVDVIDTTNNCTSECLVSGGSLTADTNYVVAIYAVWQDGDRRTTNYTRAMNWTTFRTNSTHKGVNISYTFDGNTSQIWIKGVRAGTTPLNMYYTWQCNASSEGVNYCYGSNIVYGMYYFNKTEQKGWFFHNTTSVVNYGEESDGDWCNWGSCSEYMMGAWHDLNVPMFRCWGTSVDMTDFYNADQSMGWGKITKENTTRLDWSTSTDYSQYHINGNLQIGSQYGTCTFSTKREQIELAQYLYVYNGSLDSGLKTGGYTYEGTDWLYTMPYGSYYIGMFRVENGATLNFYDSSFRWAGAGGTKLTYLIGMRQIMNGTIDIQNALFDRLSGFVFVNGADVTINNIYITGSDNALELWTVASSNLNNIKIGTSTRDILVRDKMSIKNFEDLGGTSYSVYMYCNVKQFNVTDSTFNDEKTMWCGGDSNNRNIYEFKTFNLTVVNETGNIIEGANITIISLPEKWNYTDTEGWVLNNSLSSYTQFNGSTDANGKIGFSFLWKNITRMDGTPYINYFDIYETKYEKFILTIKKPTYQTYNTTMTLSDKIDYTITLKRTLGSGSCNTTKLTTFTYDSATDLLTVGGGTLKNPITMKDVFDCDDYYGYEQVQTDDLISYTISANFRITQASGGCARSIFNTSNEMITIGSKDDPKYFRTTCMNLTMGKLSEKGIPVNGSTLTVYQNTVYTSDETRFNLYNSRWNIYAGAGSYSFYFGGTSSGAFLDIRDSTLYAPDHTFFFFRTIDPNSQIKDSYLIGGSSVSLRIQSSNIAWNGVKIYEFSQISPYYGASGKLLNSKVDGIYTRIFGGGVNWGINETFNFTDTMLPLSPELAPYCPSGASGTVYEQYTLNLKIIDNKTDGMSYPVSGVNVSIYNRTEDLIYSGTTNSTGQIPTQTLNRFSWNCSEDYNPTKREYQPYRFVITNSSGFLFLNFTENITKKTDWIIPLNVSSGAVVTESPQTETVYCAWYRNFKIGDKEYILCIDQNAKTKIFILGSLGILAVPIIKKRRRR